MVRAAWQSSPISRVGSVKCPGLYGKDKKFDFSKVAVSRNGIELQDREFFAAIREGREPNSSVAQVLSCYRVLDQLER